MVHIERERGILQNRPALQNDVISDLLFRADSNFDSPIWGSQIVAGLSDSISNEDGDEKE
jgi:hypothetical protein